MKQESLFYHIQKLLNNIPNDWIHLTTHRLDIYNEEKAKTEFLLHFEELLQEESITEDKLLQLPTAYDYIRLGHPLSCILEWTIGKLHNLPSENIISFDSKTMPILAVLRTNKQKNISTRIILNTPINDILNEDILQKIYEYSFEVVSIESETKISKFDGCTLYIQSTKDLSKFQDFENIDFQIIINEDYGSVIAMSKEVSSYVEYIQHVRRRESIAMTPTNSYKALAKFIGIEVEKKSSNYSKYQEQVTRLISKITGARTPAIIGSSGLSVQYAIMMGLIHFAKQTYPNKKIAFLVPPNCYGGTNDQARRVAASITNVEIVDLPVDSGNDMVQSLDHVLEEVSSKDLVPFIIAEIPTNPRVEVPNMKELASVLSKKRKTTKGANAIVPVFILDQTFCPNTSFLREEDWLQHIPTIAYVSGSKFPSGGRCTAGYCVSNNVASNYMAWIQKHMMVCDNYATSHQMEILAEQLPSMISRINLAYENAREFVDYIQKTLPEAKINFVSKQLAKQGFTPSVFSLDLPTKGETNQERETYKRKLNLKLISMMISEIPEESKYCVSYGQLKGCYWTIPATSTQGTTKESDKDYIVRVAIAPKLNLSKHKEIFKNFVETIIN